MGAGPVLSPKVLVARPRGGGTRFFLLGELALQAGSQADSEIRMGERV